ncbi:MAG: FxDxF family PEP-CTERM protein [Nitrosomonas sp.]|nr:MAG: FxDxF family PEP-CTERM protein [Nitrosomonas sp.]
MLNHLKLKACVAALLLGSGVVHAGTAFLNGGILAGNGSEANPYDMGVIGGTPSVMAVTVTGTPNSFFDEFANFTITTNGQVSGAANTYTLTFNGFNLVEITGLTVEVWDNSHPNGSTLYASFSGNNATNLIGDLAPGSYHLDISGNLGPTAGMGQYSVALSAVPEPETYAMILAGLGLIGFSLRKRTAA